MAMESRTYKPHPRPRAGINWTLMDLYKYNIAIEYQDAQTFFGLPEEKMPIPAISCEEFYTVQSVSDSDGVKPKAHAFHLISLLERSILHPSAHRFTLSLLKTLGHYLAHPRCVFTPLDPSGQQRLRNIQPFLLTQNTPTSTHNSESHICTLYNTDTKHIGLIVHECRSASCSSASPAVTVPPLIAAAIAAFQKNSGAHASAGFGLGRNPTRTLTRPPQEQLIPAILMQGTAPLFFKIPVTQELARGIQWGPELVSGPDGHTYQNGNPLNLRRTVVAAYKPRLPTTATLRNVRECMRPLDNRLLVMKCFEAFKRFVV
ncbi:hypothetical protein H0H92_005172 [Tricholoma furcatifolium]|nr:hypothetical protein H0H92_005172 [Tricholoma furcatifolium]